METILIGTVQGEPRVAGVYRVITHSRLGDNVDDVLAAIKRKGVAK